MLSGCYGPCSSFRVASVDGWSTGPTCVSHAEHLHLYPATGHKMVL